MDVFVSIVFSRVHLMSAIVMMAVLLGVLHWIAIVLSLCSVAIRALLYVTWHLFLGMR